MSTQSQRIAQLDYMIRKGEQWPAECFPTEAEQARDAARDAFEREKAAFLRERIQRTIQTAMRENPIY